MLVSFSHAIYIYRTLFCEKYIVPRTTAAGKYISLYRKIRDNGHYIHPVDSGGGNNGGANIGVTSTDDANDDGKGAETVAGKLCSIQE